MLVKLYFTPMNNDGREQQAPLQRSTKKAQVASVWFGRKLNIGNRKHSNLMNNKGCIMQNTEVKVGNKKKILMSKMMFFFLHLPL